VSGIIVFALAAFVVFRRRDSLGLGGAAKAVENAPKNWLAEAMAASPDTPSPYTLNAAANAAGAKPQPKYNIPAPFMESGNPVYAGIKEEARHSVGTAKASPQGAPKLTRDQVFDKLTQFYAKVDPNKNVADISDLSNWIMVHGEEALYVKLRKKYGMDPNSIPTTSQARYKNDIDV